MVVLSFLSALVSPALAATAPDLTTAIVAPSGQYVYTSAKWQFTTTNVGNRDAGTVTMTVQLPITNTSPSVSVMGTVGATNCTKSGTKLTCTASSLKKGKTATWYAWLTLPESVGSIDFSATASTSGETRTTNNSSSATASLLHYSPALAGPVTVLNRHCTGTSLESFFECELYPSSISDHEAVLESDGSITIPDAPDYSGTWWLSGSELSFEYTDTSGDVIVEFSGNAVDNVGCWEGLTTFPGSSYVSPYEVCLQ